MDTRARASVTRPSTSTLFRPLKFLLQWTGSQHEVETANPEVGGGGGGGNHLYKLWFWSRFGL